MLANEDLRRAKAAVEDGFLEMPDVIGVGIGFKERNGQQADILSIRVFVTEKKPFNELSEDQRIPSMVENYYTDVVETSPARYAVDTGRYDPLLGGISIGTCGGQPGPGTLGTFVQDIATGGLGVLSCWHVLVGGVTSSSALTVAQPAPGDGGICPSDTVGTVTRAVISDRVDCAVARIFTRLPALNVIQDTPPLNSTPTMPAQVGWPVIKRGRTTGLTYGTVEDIHVTIKISASDGTTRTHTEQIRIARTKSANISFCLPGDSGAVVLDRTNRRIIGLLFAASDPGFLSQGACGYANPIDEVLFALGVRIFNPKIKEKDKEKDEEKDSEKLIRKEIESGMPDQIVSPGREGVGLASIREQEGPLWSRLARLEASVDEMRHFINEQDRPDQV